MRREEIARHFDAIVAFAEVERFIDTPVKHYSSGMYLRLAFAVAAHLDTEILLVDEVLAVGDAAFQRKCLGKMGEVASAGRTVLFVSHNMGAVVSLCQRALWIDSGRIASDGPVEAIAHEYLSALSRRGFQVRSEPHGFAIRSVVLRDGAGRVVETFPCGSELVVDVEYEVEKPIVAPNFLVTVEGLRATCFTANMQLDGRHPDRIEGRGHLLCRFRRLPLLPQAYTVRLGVKTQGGKENVVPLQDVASFTVTGGEAELSLRGERFLSLASHSSPVVIDYDWILPDGRVESVGLGPEPVGLSEPSEEAIPTMRPRSHA
jgi:lipopolysaccharide transport system ATP-binding protein